ncbi:PCYCGC motif-containing (lipo)protein [Bacillus sp. 1NLA3E]|uniref:PCYCGC motif-containing (lipo)protein n=1 Tax=Bacillus sp. 1NLA3E TaxID=666686 RepID=UPI000247EC55|nr:PCYCGC motif-containing (lipo)protein [Bacillus sp. 1NLA3E]AGK53441.1 hypothetical protein B1NLA3E_08395 [Bacillus sp. 1NLA3E]
MKYTSFIVFSLLLVIILAGCSPKKELTLDSKHAKLPDYVTSSSDIIKQTYIMAAEYPKVLASVPCYCGCTGDGHKSNLDCFVSGISKDNQVTEWDQHGVSCDTCVDIAQDSVEMYQDGKSLKDINKLIVKKYESVGEPTPTPVPK